uniref:Uncharacterized protein n=1 Tax=Cucumis melo TaxID=3656 RepID=A0A9I9E4Z0_CUCME
MTNIPPNSVLWSIENIVKSHHELHHAKAGTQVTTSFRNVEDDIGSYFIS